MNVSLDTFRESAPRGEAAFQHAKVAGLPHAAQRYPEHAIKQGTPLACAVRLPMHGEIKLKRWQYSDHDGVRGRYHSFAAGRDA